MYHSGKTECSFLLPADNRHGNIGSGMNTLQERRTVAGCSYGSRGNCKCLCHLVNFGKMCIYLETVNCTVLCGIRKKRRIIAHSFRQADRTFFLIYELINSFGADRDDDEADGIGAKINDSDAVHNLPLSCRTVITILQHIKKLW